ncbi:DUF2934 domain-containing protein [Crenothrix sp.]|uniref:DUF2934 domain-containing protein n=1 Tax=Crenothrix sp. TaxID=3100433 RepID=UPI00374DA865
MKKTEATTPKTKKSQLEAANFSDSKAQTLEPDMPARSSNGVETMPESDNINPDMERNTDSSNSSDSAICLPDRDAKISELAYYKAENRGFDPGHELEDWFAAEQEFML